MYLITHILSSEFFMVHVAMCNPLVGISPHLPPYLPLSPLLVTLPPAPSLRQHMFVLAANYI